VTLPQEEEGDLLDYVGSAFAPPVRAAGPSGMFAEIQVS
jgi:hypothetical protein